MGSKYKNRHRNSVGVSPPVSTQPNNQLTPFDPRTNEQVKVGIPFPPDEIFKNRQRRIDVPNQIFVNSATFIPYRAEYRKDEGNFVYYAGLHTPAGDMPAPLFPSRCVAPADAIYAANPVKRTLINSLKFLAGLSLSPKKILNNALDLFINQSELTLNPFYLQDEYYCPISREIRKFVGACLAELGADAKKSDYTGEIVGCLFEYDNAYRYRVQDVLNETTKEKLLSDFPNEIMRLIKIMSAREANNQSVPDRFLKAAKVLRWAWRIPWTKRAIKKGILAMNLDACKWEEGELYHTIWFGDYNVQGKDFDERMEIYKKYHGTDESKWPPRIILK